MSNEDSPAEDAFCSLRVLAWVEASPGALSVEAAVPPGDWGNAAGGVPDGDADRLPVVGAGMPTKRAAVDDGGGTGSVDI